MKEDLTINQGKDRDAYTRLVALLERHPEADPVQRGLSLAVLGDWATVTEKTADAADYYRQAWQTLSSSPGFDVAQYFADPVALDFVTPLSAVDRGERSKPYAWISAAVRFDLTSAGRPLNVEAVGVDRPIPSNTLLSRYLRRIRETHFRPRLVDGEAAATRGVEFAHYFRVYVDDKKKDKKQD